MRRRQGASLFKWGMGMFALIAVLLYLTFTGGANPLANPFSFKAVFANAATTINSNSPVRIAGVNVGKVTRVEKGPGNTAMVEMAIEPEGLPIHQDATLKLRPRLFLEGNFFVEVQPGTPSAPELKRDGTIPLAQTATPVQIDQVLDTFTSDPRTNLQQLLKGFADAVAQGGDVALRRTFKALGPASLGIAQSAEATRGIRNDDLSRIIADQGTFLGAINDQSTQLGDLITGFRRTMGAFADRQAQLAATIRGLDSTVQTIRPALTELDRALPPIRRFAVALEPALLVAPGVLDHASAFLGATKTLLRSDRAGALLRLLSPTVQELRTSERLLPPLLSQVQPVATCVRDKGIPILNSPLQDGDLTNGLPAWKELASLGVGLSGAAGNFTGDGYAVRYSLGLSQDLVATPAVNFPDTFQLTNSTITGARPRWVQNSQPPFKPEVDCQSQPLQSLNADAAAAASAGKRIKLPAFSSTRVRTLLDQLSKATNAQGLTGGVK
jgi:ABC-type transporter Mla subunit MlaD